MYHVTPHYSDSVLSLLAGFFPKFGALFPPPSPPPLWLVPQPPPLVATLTSRFFGPCSRVVPSLTQTVLAASSPCTIKPLVLAAGLMAAVTLASGCMIFSRNRAKPHEDPPESRGAPLKQTASTSLCASASSFCAVVFNLCYAIFSTVVLVASGSPSIAVALVLFVHRHLRQIVDVQRFFGKARHKNMLVLAIIAAPDLLHHLWELRKPSWEGIELFIDHVIVQSPRISASINCPRGAFIVAIAVCSTLAGYILVHVHVNSSALRQALDIDFLSARPHVRIHNNYIDISNTSTTEAHNIKQQTTPVSSFIHILSLIYSVLCILITILSPFITIAFLLYAYHLIDTHKSALVFRITTYFTGDGLLQPSSPRPSWLCWIILCLAATTRTVNALPALSATPGPDNCATLNVSANIPAVCATEADVAPLADEDAGTGTTVSVVTPTSAIAIALPSVQDTAAKLNAETTPTAASARAGTEPDATSAVLEDGVPPAASVASAIALLTVEETALVPRDDDEISTAPAIEADAALLVIQPVTSATETSTVTFSSVNSLVPAVVTPITAIAPIKYFSAAEVLARCKAAQGGRWLSPPPYGFKRNGNVGTKMTQHAPGVERPFFFPLVAGPDGMATDTRTTVPHFIGADNRLHTVTEYGTLWKASKARDAFAIRFNCQ